MVVSKVLLERLVDKLVVLPSLARSPGLGSSSSGCSSGGPSFSDGGHHDVLNFFFRLESGRLSPQGEALSFFLVFFLEFKSRSSDKRDKTNVDKTFEERRGSVEKKR